MKRPIPHFLQPGIHDLLKNHRSWLAHRRVGLVTHPAAVDSQGAHCSERLHRAIGDQLVALFGPEHGFFGNGLAGDSVGHQRHPDWRIPVYSLYGENRRPTPAMLKGIEAIVFDLQDLGARPYTFVGTLRYVMEAIAGTDCRLIVADRPIPLPNAVDGPITDEKFASFVASIPGPMHYGMTPGETARWLKHKLALDVDLEVARLQPYHRAAHRASQSPPWIPPSQGIRSWESAWCYTATVFGEALSSLDHGRGTGLPFQVFGAKWMNGRRVCEALATRRLHGVRFHPHRYEAGGGHLKGTVLDGVRMTVTAPDRFRPVTLSLHILEVLQNLHGPRRVWSAPGSRPAFFDALYGTDSVRLALKAGRSAGDIAASWRSPLRRFRRERGEAMLYGDT